MRRFVAAVASACFLALLTAIGSCGGHNPGGPTPGGGNNGGGNQQPPPNNLPVIDSITIQGRRSNEPANFADVGESIDLTAKVHDDETPADQLQYEWSASTGTLDGTGPKVTWMAPSGLSGSAPADVTITLKVIEKYGQPGGPLTFQHDVSSTATLSLHDSVKEIGDMARQFLVDFSDSTIRDVSYIMRNFDPSCAGTQSESSQVADNRVKFKIDRWNVGQPTVDIPFGNAFCPVPLRVQRGDACSTTPVRWESTVVKDGHHQVADGMDWISAFYLPALKAWKLCDSQFTGTCVDTTTGKPCTDNQLRSMVAGSIRP